MTGRAGGSDGEGSQHSTCESKVSLGLLVDQVGGAVCGAASKGVLVACDRRAGRVHNARMAGLSLLFAMG